MELSDSNIKTFFIFHQKKAFLIFREMETLKEFLMFQKMETLENIIFKEVTFLTEKKPTLKKCLTFQEMELSSHKLKIFFIFWEGTCKT